MKWFPCKSQDLPEFIYQLNLIIILKSELCVMYWWIQIGTEIWCLSVPTINDLGIHAACTVHHFSSVLQLAYSLNRLTKSSQDTTTPLVRSGSTGSHPHISAELERALQSSPHSPGVLWPGWRCGHVIHGVSANERGSRSRRKLKCTKRNV